jgi:hypothetical protein
MGEAAGIAAELDLVEQLSAANAPFSPTARQIVEEILGRAGLWRRGAALWRRCDQPIEAEHLSLSFKETGLEDPLKGTVPLSGAFRADSGSARQFVRRVTTERNEVRHLVWIDALSLPDLFRPDARYFPAP